MRSNTYQPTVPPLIAHYHIILNLVMTYFIIDLLVHDETISKLYR
jgi:hypothetical protein